MWSAGIGWTADGFECVVVDGDGGAVGPRAAFPPGAVVALTAHLTEVASTTDGLRVVIDSTDGMVEGSLMAAGFRLYRADPAVLPPRPAFGSPDAAALARLPLADLTALSIADGTIAGRGEETAAAIAGSAGAEWRLAAAGRFVAHGTRERPVVALTFDDGPDPRFTPAVLDVLRDHAAPATFFCVGMNVAGHPGLVARAAAEGHAVANHTWSHAYLPELTRDEVLRQVEATNAAVAAVTGVPPVLARPPYGARTPDVLDWLAEAGLTTVVWDVDPGDWARPPAEVIPPAVVGTARNGSIVLMHDAGGDRSATVAALPRVIEGLRAAGYRIAPLADVVTPG